MTRPEYEAKKYELHLKRQEIDAELDKLRNDFQGSELAEYQNKYNGKYVIQYERDYLGFQTASKAIIDPNYFTIFKVDKVNFVGIGFFRFEGTCWRVDLENKNPMEPDDEKSISIVSYKDDQMDCHFADEIVTKEEALKRLKDSVKIIETIVSELGEG